MSNLFSMTKINRKIVILTEAKRKEKSLTPHISIASQNKQCAAELFCIFKSFICFFVIFTPEK